MGVITINTYDPDNWIVRRQQTANNTILRTASVTYTRTDRR